MTSLFSVRKRAEEFAAVVDGSADPGTHPDLAELAGVVTALREHDQPVPRAEFAADLRERLMAEAAEVLTPSNAGLVLPARTRGRRERRLAAAAAALVFVGGTAGMAAAAQHALPGDALYPIKRGIEHAQAGLSTSPAGKGRDLLHQANDRLTEVAGLLAADPSTAAPEIPQTIDDFTAQAQEGAQLMMTSFGDTRDPASIVAVREFAAHGLTTLQDVARNAPADSQDELAAAAVALSEIDQQAQDLCASCASDLPDLDVPPMFLATAEVDRALRDPALAQLDNSHPVIVDKRAVQQPAHASDSSGSAPKSPAAVPGAPSAPTATSAPTPGLQLPALPGSNDQTKKGSTDVGKTVDSTVNGITDGLGGVVETLLPDPTSLP